MIDFTNLQKMIEEKYISVQKHPTMDLYIYNYTQRAQFDRVWNNETLQCRGLIMNKNKNIIARPFKKFFNYAEAIANNEQIPAEDFLVTEKMDGSLGILYWDEDNKPNLATRGSFVSDQAIKGTQILRDKYPQVHGANPFFTLLFEIIYPENRIVVDYGKMEDIVLLAAVQTDLGVEEPYEDLLKLAEKLKLPVVKKYDAIRNFDKIEARPNAEGYVITFPTAGKRYKIKFEEYVRLHRLITGVNKKTIWELLRANQDFSELLEKVPDEFYEWVKNTRDELNKQYDFVEQAALTHYEDIRDLPTRKDQALAIKAFNFEKSREVGSIIFALLSDKPYDQIIWKQIKPKAEKPFKEDIDA